MAGQRFWMVALLGCALSACGEDKKAANPLDCTDPSETRCRSDSGCNAGDVRCGVGRVIEKCKSDGKGWNELAKCEEGQSCVGGQCDPASCQSGQSMCTADGKIRTCLGDVGTFSLPVGCEQGKTCIGTSCQRQVCTPNQRFCDGEITVRECDPQGTQARVADMCQGNSRCSMGACRSPCIVAEMKHTSIGCSFYGADLDNMGGDDPLEVYFGVANDTDQPGHVKIEVREGGTWRSVCEVDLRAKEARLVGMNKNANCAVDEPTTNLMDRHIEDSGYLPGAGFRITSDVPIAAYQFNSNDQIRAYSSGGTVLFPTHALGQKYYASTMPHPDPARLYTRPGDMPGQDVPRAEIAIVGTIDGTQVSVTPTASIFAGPGVSASPAGTKVMFTIDEGALLQLATVEKGADLTGSLIESNQPIAVFGSNECATIFPRNTMNPGFRSEYCDHTEEALLPIQAWGKNFVAARVRPLTDAPGALDATVWRILASEADTTVTFSAPMGVTTEPPTSMPMKLGAGEFKDLAVNITSFEQASDLEIHADKPIMVVGYMAGETVATNAVPVEQFLSQYTFIVPGKFRSQLTVVRQKGAKVKLDGMVMGDNLFLPSGGDWEVGRVDFERDAFDTGTGGTPKSHFIETETIPDGGRPKIWIEVRGMDEDCSYGYTGGLSIEIINPIG